MRGLAQLIGIDPGVRNMIHAKANALAGLYGFTSNDREDIAQELLLACILKLPRLDPGRSCQRTFLHLVVNSQVATLIERQMASRRDYRRCRSSLDDPVKSATGDWVELGETVSADDDEIQINRGVWWSRERAELRIDVSRVIATLPPELAAIATLLRSVSVVETARRLRVPRATLCRRLADIRRAFESAGLGLYLGRPGTALVGRRHRSTAVVEAVAQAPCGPVQNYATKATAGRQPR
jgi:DNA-directed RNA polymerase specialized sigma24 family protein